MTQIDLKDGYFSLPINKDHRKYLRFVWEDDSCEFLCLCFALYPASLIFTKLLKEPIALTCWLNIRQIIYLDGMSIMTRSAQELIFHQDTVIYLLQNLRFFLNITKSAPEPSQTMKFLGLITDSVKMEISLPKAELVKLINLCRKICKTKESL